MLAPADLAARIGMPTPSVPAVPEPVRRVDGPIESQRPAPARPVMIGADEPVPPKPAEQDVAPPQPVGKAVRPMMIGLEETVAAPIVTVREAPTAGEMDLVVTPLATPDDWHHFELALRRLPGVGPLRTEYYRAGILKLRLRWSGPERLAEAVTNMPGYRVGILGEDRSTVQIRVARTT